MDAAAAIAINAMNLIEDAWEYAVRRPENTPGYILKRYDPAAFDFAARALGEANLADVPDWELIRPIIGVRNLVMEAKDLPFSRPRGRSARPQGSECGSGNARSCARRSQ